MNPFDPSSLCRSLLLACLLTALSPNESAQAQAIAITNAGFDPQVVQVPVHTTVTWTNLEGVHTATSPDGLWDSGVLTTGQAFGHTFDTAGLYAYHDTIHDWPSGIIQVVHSLAAIEVSTDAALYVSGEPLRIGLALDNPGAAVQAGVHVWLDTPVGVQIPLLNVPSFQLPAGFSYANPSWMSLPLPPLPRGDYAVHGSVVKVPEGDPIGVSAAAWAFGEVVQSDWTGGSSPDWREIHWDAQVPPGTSLAVEVRASNDPAALGPFLTVPHVGFDLAGLIPADARYLQYRVSFNSTDPQSSPVLRELSVNRGAGW